MILEYYRIRKGAVPSRANPSDAGLDLPFNPISGLPKYIEPGESAILETGIKFGVPHGYMLEIKNRSSMAAKKSLLVGACVVDSGYDGEIFVNIHNIGKEAQRIFPCDRIAQAVLIPVVHFRALETHEDNLYGWYPITISERADGALGSSDNNEYQN
tara:strand:- start:1301 stop:1771 length:471 start_codon:yes stop_codon:yes gene_type:complete